MQEHKGARIAHEPRLQDVGNGGDRGVDIPDTHHIKVDRLQPGVHVDHAEDLPVILAHFPSHHIQCCRRGGEGLIRIKRMPLSQADADFLQLILFRFLLLRHRLLSPPRTQW